MPRIVIPDDYPVVMGSSPSFLQWRDNASSVYFDTLPGSEEGLLARIGNAEVVINIRSSTRFPATVFAACPQLKLLSIWGTGTDSVDLAAARQYDVTVTNTPGVSAASIAEHSLMLALAVARRVVDIHEAGLALAIENVENYLNVTSASARLAGAATTGRGIARTRRVTMATGGGKRGD